ncbi:ankyrin repeat domain-containing protein 11-like isoform X2 [Planococcus citri]|uniref:ankyrin repeat domain-containing protein 11-like isoform X2 n=1 Tax=Planococcus citri TaxID=170843 RepID=UPI0031F7E78B
MNETDKNHMLENLKVFIDEQKTWLRNTLDFVGWNISDLETLAETDETHFVPCSINSEHRIPREKLLKHEMKCEKINGDYPKITDGSDVEVTIDVKDAIHSTDGIKSEPNDDIDLTDNTTKNKNKSKGDSICLIELLAAERDAKRRRAAHRGKRVHSNKKSYVEVLREVVASQMESLNERFDIETGSDAVEVETAQKAVIQPRIDSYLGVGSKYYDGNPFKRWMHIEKEEKELLEETQSGDNEKHPDNYRRRESSSERYKTRERSRCDYDNDGRHRRHREHSKDNNYRYRDYKFNDDRDNYSKRRDEKSSSHYDNEKYSQKRSHKEDRLKEKHRGDNFSDSYDYRMKREKRSRERSQEFSEKHKNFSHSYTHEIKREKRSRERSHDSSVGRKNVHDLYESIVRSAMKCEKRSQEPSRDFSEKHKKKRKKKSRERSNDSSDGHKKKHKKSSHKQSVHKKKHHKSKHHDSNTE